MCCVVWTFFNYLLNYYIFEICSIICNVLILVKNCTRYLDAHFFSLNFCVSFRQSRSTIREYFVRCLTLRVASCNIWRSSPTGEDIPGFLLSMARSLFQQVFFFSRIGDAFIFF